MAEEKEKRGSRRRVQGTVLSDSMDKTIVVAVKRLVKHPRYEKRLYRTMKAHCHDEHNEAKEGDLVEIMETRPLSKKKRWRLVKVVRAAESVGA